MNYIRKYNCQQIINGYTNHFDTLPNDLIEKILQYMYPIEVYNSKKNNDVKNKKNILEKLKIIKIIICLSYDALSIEKKIKYIKEFNNQYYLKPEMKKNLFLSNKKIKKSVVDKIMYKQNKLLLNNICVLKNMTDDYLKKCICGNYCINPLYKWYYKKYNKYKTERPSDELLDSFYEPLKKQWEAIIKLFPILLLSNSFKFGISSKSLIKMRSSSFASLIPLDRLSL